MADEKELELIRDACFNGAPPPFFYVKGLRFDFKERFLGQDKYLLEEMICKISNM